MPKSIRQNGYAKLIRNSGILGQQERIPRGRIYASDRSPTLFRREDGSSHRVSLPYYYRMSYKEQVGTMLTENMQRVDLTIPEQAEGFQMMLDLGDTVEDIANKTGFSESTVRHRVNIAKLDKSALKEKNDDEGFQLTLKDHV